MKKWIVAAAMLAINVALITAFVDCATEALAAPVAAQAVVRSDGVISLPEKIELQPGRLAKVSVVADQKAKRILWINGDPDALDLIESETGRWIIVSSPKPGTYRIFAYSAIDGEPTPAASTVVIVLGTPGPKPPTPPNPPNPPDPQPGPAPIPEAGFRVLMVYETATIQKLPPAQNAVLYSKKLRDYLDAKCVVGPDGKTKEWRCWDKDVDLGNEKPLWQNAMKRPRQSVPWILISTGTSGYEGPLPANLDETLSLLKKYGGE